MKTKQISKWFEPAQHIDNEQHATIIGGGIAGSQIAWHLAEHGWQVTLIERHAQLATEASGNKAGAITPKMTAQASLGETFYSQCFLYIHQQLQTLRNQGYKFAWESCGALQLNHNKRELKRWLALKQRNFSDDFLQCLDAKEASTIAGIPLTIGASYFPKGGWVNPASLCRALCSHKNITTMLHTEAMQLEYKDQQWIIKDKSQQTLLSSNTVIIANGKDIQQFDLTKHLPFQAVLGQTTEAKAGLYTKQLKTVIGHEGYLTPQIDGQHIFGATFQREFSKVELTDKSSTINYQQLKKHLPNFAEDLGDCKNSHAAVRMTTPDRFPYVGAMPKRDFYNKHYADIGKGQHWKHYPKAEYHNGLFVFAGHASRGITTTGYCANYLASLINNEDLEIFPRKIKEALHVARFDIRRLKQGKTLEKTVAGKA